MSRLRVAPDSMRRAPNRPEQLSVYRLATPVVAFVFIFSFACTFTIAMKFTAITAPRCPLDPDTAPNDKLPLFHKCLPFYARIPRSVDEQ
ncbi:unnamed protein product [Colias eurytheme]|nr:unnamed protein product [Colias eurytheme]